MEDQTKTEVVESEEFKGKDLTFTIHRKPKCTVEFHVKASPSLVKAAYQNAVKAVSKHVSFPGFRKGRAPPEAVQKKYPGEIDKEWQQEIANAAFPECEKIAHIPILKKDSKISFNLKSHSLDKGAELVLTFETEPTIPAVEPKKFNLNPVERPAVTDVQIEETIRQIHFFFAQWKPINDRPVQEGDFVILDVEVIDNAPSHPLFSNTRFEVTDKSMAKWMKDLVIGQQIGSSVEGESYPDATVSEKEKENFPAKKIRITVKVIEEAILPPMDEKLLSMVGVTSHDELRSNVERLLNEKADSHVKEAQRTQVVDFLLHQHPFDLPPSFIMNETRFRMKQLSSDPQFSAEWSKMTKDEQNNAIQALMSQSEKAVRLFYICNRLIKDAGIKISPEDLPKPPTTPLEVLIRPQPDYQLQEQDELKEAEAYSRLILEKAEDYIIQQAKTAV